MPIRLRTVFFLGLGALLIWFLYIERAILTPFILAAVFAYLFNPVVNFFSDKIKLPRTIAILIIYALIISVIVFASVNLTKRILDESYELTQYAKSLSLAAKQQIAMLPDWIRPSVSDTIYSLEKTRFFTSASDLSFFPKAFSGIISLIIFLFSAFYFLKEGKTMKEKFLTFMPNEYKFEIEILLRKINTALGSYLRGQIFLVILVSTVLFIALSILGVKFALIIAIFSGFAEIVPIIGPIVAASVAATVAFIGGTSNFSLMPFQTAIAVVIIYTVVRQLQDYLVNPYIMGKITKLHPLVILFAVLAGEHTAGIIGLILAVPVAGIIRILLEFSLDKVANKKNEE